MYLVNLSDDEVVILRNAARQYLDQHPAEEEWYVKSFLHQAITSLEAHDTIFDCAND